MSSDLIATPTLSRADVAERVAAAVTAVPGVSGLGRGVHVAAATYAGTRRVPGVVVRPERIAVHVEVDRLPLQPVAEAVRAAVARALVEAAWPQSPEIAVVVENLRLEQLPESAP